MQQEKLEIYQQVAEKLSLRFSRLHESLKDETFQSCHSEAVLLQFDTEGFLVNLRKDLEDELRAN